ncbi:EamA family transporter, partial [uncultured Cetobacterium sp.]|uniref:DMT family transporter n=1 Tax=uncultured Cetobacterium sp. TaxID=527638 RepID=UPI0026272C70
MNSKLKIIISMIAFGTISIFVKGITLPSSEIAFYRAIIALLVLSIFMIFNREYFQIESLKNNWFKLFISGLAIGFNWIFLFEAYNYTSVAVATLCYYFAPIVVVVASSIIFKEKLSLKQILCFLGSTTGLIFIISYSTGTEKSDVKGILFGLGAALLYSTVILLNKSMKDINGISRTVFQFAAAVMTLMPYVGITSGFNIYSLSNLGLINLFILGAFHTGIVYVLYFSSISKLKGQEVAIFSYLDPLVAVLISILWFGETITSIQLIGGLLILLFTF